MELLSYEVQHTGLRGSISKPTPYGGVSADGGIQIQLEGKVRCQICQTEKNVRSYDLKVFAVRKAIESEIEHNLSWLVDRLCKTDYVCKGCGFSSRCRKVDRDKVLAELQEMLTVEWFFARFEEYQIPIGTKIKEYT